MSTFTPPMTLTARSPEDLLAVVPVVLGFVPTDSVVMLTFEAEHAFHARVDLPTTAEEVDEVTSALVEPATRHGVRQVVFVVFTDDAGCAARVWRALGAACRGQAIEVVEALRADSTHWYPIRDPGAPGTPYDLTSHPFVARAVLEGRVALRSRGDLAAALERRPDAVRRVADEIGGLPPDLADADGAWVCEAVAARLVEGAAPLTDAEVARLVWALEDVDVRDRVVASLTRAQARAHVDLWSEVLTRTPDPAVPPVATLLGLAAWLSGDGALAWCALDACAGVDPDYPLMTLLGTALRRAVPPAAWDELGGR